MCGRYVSPDDAAIEREFELLRNDDPMRTAASYRGPWKRGQRCLQIASGFYEWHITMPANALMAHLHNAGNHPHRMPAILRREDRRVWLEGSAEDAWAVLAPYDAGLMVTYERDPLVKAAH